jgi:hypothetical protein
MKCLCRFGSLLACESFHADVHAGNLWVLRDGRIGFLDFGKRLFFLMRFFFFFFFFKKKRNILFKKD